MSYYDVWKAADHEEYLYGEYGPEDRAQELVDYIEHAWDSGNVFGMLMACEEAADLWLNEDTCPVSLAEYAERYKAKACRHAPDEYDRFYGFE